MTVQHTKYQELLLAPAGFAMGTHKKRRNTMDLRPFCAKSHEGADMPISLTNLTLQLRMKPRLDGQQCSSLQQ